jgi:hypothetical protein
MLKTEKYFLLLESKNLTKDITLEMLRSKDGVEVPPKYYENAQRVSTNVQKIKDYIEKKTGKRLVLNLTSGYRSPQKNINVGGKPKSHHQIANAIDFSFENYPLSDTLKDAKQMMELGLIDVGAIVRYTGDSGDFIHYDIRGYYTSWNLNVSGNTKSFTKRGDLSVFKPVNVNDLDMYADLRKRGELVKGGNFKISPSSSSYTSTHSNTSKSYTSNSSSTPKQVKKSNKNYDLKNVDIDTMAIKIEDFKDLSIEGGHS